MRKVKIIGSTKKNNKLWWQDRVGQTIEVEDDDVFIDSEGYESVHVHNGSGHYIYVQDTELNITLGRKKKLEKINLKIDKNVKRR
jgi:hypothetical protein